MSAHVGDIARKVRSKNAGPFWLTIDVFCGSPKAFARLRDGLATDAVAGAFHIAPSSLHRYDIANLLVIKFSLPRPEIQGARRDRDMHGASFGEIVSGLEVQARP